MIFGSLSRRLALLASVSASLWLASCGGGGGGDDNGPFTIRAINLTTDLASVDLYADDTKLFGALAADTMATATTYNSGTYSLGVRRAGDSSTLLSGSFALAKNYHYTALITGRESSLVLRALPEDEDTNNIASGKSRVRLFNLTSDTAGVDVFITSDTADIGDTLPTLRFTTNSLSDFIEFATGSYRLRVTSVGNPTDVRLDVPLSTLTSKQFHTLVLTSGSGGPLVNALLIPQQGTPTLLKNTKARVRVAAGADSNGNVSASIGGATLVGTLRSPAINTYLLVNAATQDLSVRINGSVVSTGNQTFAPGADYTVLVYGTPAASGVKLLVDDNRLPTTSTRAKIRLVNGVAGSEPMTLQLDFLPLASDVVLGTASPYFTANSVGSSRAEVSSLNATDALFSVENTTGLPLLQAQGVYTVFMLGGATAPTGVLRKDR